MPSTDRCSGIWRLLSGVALGLYLSAPAYAFTPSDSPLLSAAAVPPNVMLLIDDSGSMNNIIWAPDFNPAANQAPIANCSSNSSCFTGQSLDMDDTNIALSSLYRGGCSTNGNWYGFYRGFLGLSSICLKLPDPVGNENTRYTANYLSYLVTQANGANRDYTTGAIPNDYRMNVAKEVSKNSSPVIARCVSACRRLIRLRALTPALVALLPAQSVICLPLAALPKIKRTITSRP